ncbi:MAG: hypothetical protein CMR00_05000 [[Chlorobium] sp. 445]|nr:MAG: hypothetical protein CMR00_05000 [[Chlorobium] sp. 445]
MAKVRLKLSEVFQQMQALNKEICIFFAYRYKINTMSEQVKLTREAHAAEHFPRKSLYDHVHQRL